MAVLLAPAGALAQEEAAPPEWFHSVTLAGGLTLVAQNTSGNNVDKAKDQADFSFSTDLLITAKIDEEQQIFFGLEAGDGHSVSDNIGSRALVNYDAYITSIGGMTRLNVSQAYYKAELAGGMFVFAAGKMDQPALTDANQFANDETTQFLNGLFVRSFGVVFHELPFYYAPTLYLQLKVPFFSFTSSYSNPDGFDLGGKRCVVAQVGAHVGDGDMKGNYLFGYTSHKEEFTKLSSGAAAVNTGFFVSLDQGFGPFGLFFRFAQQDKTIAQNEVISAMSGGISINGFMENEGNGVGLAYGTLELNTNIIKEYNTGMDVAEFYIRFGTSAKTQLTLDIQRLNDLERPTKRQIYVGGIRFQANI